MEHILDMWSISWICGAYLGYVGYILDMWSIYIGYVGYNVISIINYDRYIDIIYIIIYDRYMDIIYVPVGLLFVFSHGDSK